MCGPCLDRGADKAAIAEQRKVSRLTIRKEENIVSLALADTVASSLIQTLHVYTTVCGSSLGWVHTPCTAQSPHDQSAPVNRPTSLDDYGASEAHSFN